MIIFLAKSIIVKKNLHSDGATTHKRQVLEKIFSSNREKIHFSLRKTFRPSRIPRHMSACSYKQMRLLTDDGNIWNSLFSARPKNHRNLLTRIHFENDDGKTTDFPETECRSCNCRKRTRKKTEKITEQLFRTNRKEEMGEV